MNNFDLIKDLVKCNKCENIITHKFVGETIVKECGCNKLCKLCGQFKKLKSYVQNNMYIKVGKCGCLIRDNMCVGCGIQYNISYVGGDILKKCNCGKLKMHEIGSNNGIYFIKP